jgi:uncharacterized protein (DUF1684 family)
MTIAIGQEINVGRSRFEELLDYKRTVAKFYTRRRQSNLSEVEKCWHFRQSRDRLFGTHPQSALSEEQKANFIGLNYYPYDPAWRFVLPVDTNVEPEIIEIQLQDEGLTKMQRFGKIHFEIKAEPVSLSLFWILGYGGGVFLPFRDMTNNDTTYGGGRYLLDTIKHADLGHEGSKLIIDFNYAYNPSCAYNPRWNCPLAPWENRLLASIPVGEKKYSG